MNKKIIIICGDPNSINSEIIYKTLKKLGKSLRKKITLIGNYNLINSQFNKLKKKNILVKVKTLNTFTHLNKIKIINIPLKFKNPFKVSAKDSGKYLIKSLNIAHNLAIKGDVQGIINCPIDKKLISSISKVGLTEFFASKCRVKDNSEVMLIHNRKFSVVPLTTHVDLSKVSRLITKKLIIKKIETINKFYKKIFRIKPKIGILGLNPHNAEYRSNSKEIKDIIPSINALKKKGIKIKGPLVADTIFINKFKEFNVVVGMYHDQVLAPFKTMFHFDAINLTLGLKYIRVSPDHGPAKDLIGRNKANHLSLLRCIKFINNLKK